MNALDAIREHVAELPPAQLVEAQRRIAAAVSDAPAHESALCKKLAQVDAMVERRERELMLEHGRVTSDDSELNSLREAATKARAELRSNKADEVKAKELALVLRQELSSRAMARDTQERRQCEETWKGLKDEMCADAVEALAVAILATAPTHPELVDPVKFVTEEIGNQLRQRIKQEAEKMRKRIRDEICKNNPKLG